MTTKLRIGNVASKVRYPATQFVKNITLVSNQFSPSENRVILFQFFIQKELIMKKHAILALLMLSLATTVSTSALANSANDGSCFVLGVREPGTNIYDGPTFCIDTALTYITVRGPLQMSNSQVTGKTDISGVMEATGSLLQDVVFENNLSAATFTLSASTVNGDITFEGKEGTVYLQDGSVIKGKVINGKVVNQ